MDSRLKFRPRSPDVELPGDPGTKRQRFCGLTVKGRRVARPETGCRGPKGNLRIKGSGVGGREKPGRESSERPYRKPTQVGEASSLR